MDLVVRFRASPVAMKRVLRLVRRHSSAVATYQAFSLSPMGAAEVKTVRGRARRKAAAKRNRRVHANRRSGLLFSGISRRGLALMAAVEANLAGAARCNRDHRPGP